MRRAIRRALWWLLRASGDPVARAREVAQEREFSVETAREQLTQIWARLAAIDAERANIRDELRGH